MVLLLRRDVISNLRNLRLSDGECAVTSLPIEIFHPVLFHPFRALAFNVSDQLADVDPAYRDENVDVVRNASSDDHSTLVVCDNA